MGEATIEAPARPTCGPIMAARAEGSSATDCSMGAAPTADPLACSENAGRPPAHKWFFRKAFWARAGAITAHGVPKCFCGVMTTTRPRVLGCKVIAGSPCRTHHD